LDAWLTTNRLSLSLALAAIALVGAAFYFGGRAGESPLIVTAPTPVVSFGGPRAFISGEVARPGVYRFEPGDRVEQLVALAGGFTAEADVNAVNLSLRLRDEQQVHVPQLAGSSMAENESTQSALVDLNSASLVELDALPGIGPVTAERILDHRTKVGPFAQVDDLLTLKLVSAAAFEKIRPLVTVR
jgi:competence protein ComEA